MVLSIMSVFVIWWLKKSLFPIAVAYKIWIDSAELLHLLMDIFIRKAICVPRVPEKIRIV